MQTVNPDVVEYVPAAHVAHTALAEVVHAGKALEPAGQTVQSAQKVVAPPGEYVAPVHAAHWVLADVVHADVWRKPAAHVEQLEQIRFVVGVQAGVW